MKKKYVLKKWVKVTLGIILFMILFHLAFRITPAEEEMVNNCVKGGGTITECRKGVLGIYE